MTNNLPERLKAATCGSRELDAEIWAVAGGWKLVTQSDGVEVRAEKYDEDVVSEWESAGFIDSGGHFRVYMSFEEDLPPYTTSLDAALALVGEVAPEWTAWEIRSRKRKTLFSAEISKLVDGEEVIAHGAHKSAPIALILALLTALEAEGGET